MLTIHPQYLTDSADKKLVVLSDSEFKSIMDELEDIDDIRLYDAAKKEDDGERIPFTEYLKERKQKNG